jgi:hypothetical protein
MPCGVMRSCSSPLPRVSRRANLIRKSLLWKFDYASVGRVSRSNRPQWRSIPFVDSTAWDILPYPTHEPLADSTASQRRACNPEVIANVIRSQAISIAWHEKRGDKSHGEIVVSRQFTR